MASACPIKQQGNKKGRMGAKETRTQSSGNFVPQGLKGSVQYSTGVKYVSWDVPTAITNVIDQAVVVTTQEDSAPVYPETKILSVPDVKPMLSRVSSNFIISSSLESEAVSQPSVLSPEALGINAFLNVSMSTQSVRTSLCSVIPIVNATSSSSGHCYGEVKFAGVFIPIRKSVRTPVNMEVLRSELAGYPDVTMKDCLLNGSTHGFDIGYRGPRRAVQCRNQVSANANPEHITEAIKKRAPSCPHCRSIPHPII